MMTDSIFRGKIFNIQHFSIHDGPGIRTSVFMKGCPLKCVWCHNPESWTIEDELIFNSEKCSRCGMCVKVCTKNAHSIDTQNQTHTLDRSKCVVCGECAQVCYYSSLEIVGKYYTVEEVIDDVMRDKIFYDESGGGMTLSGGEPIYQFFFSQELLKKAKENGLHTAVETSGFGNTLLYGELARYTDLFLYDYKITDNEKHKKYCGVYNDLILKNLEFLNGSNANIILRCPLIDGINTDENHLKAIADLTNKYKNISEVNIEAYHPLGISKNQNIGKEPSYNNSSFMAKEDAAKYTEYIANLTDTKVILQ